MPRKIKKIKKIKLRTKKNFKKEFNKEIHYVEKWVHERKRFFKKLGWVVILIILLIILSNLYLKVSGVGI